MFLDSPIYFIPAGFPVKAHLASMYLWEIMSNMQGAVLFPASRAVTVYAEDPYFQSCLHLLQNISNLLQIWIMMR